jgi:very-short-patch-repair endonuclease
MRGKRLTTEEFINFCREKHNNFYNYEKTVYINDKNKVLIICPIHGEFYQYPSNHKKYGCNLCARKKRGMSKRFTTQELKEKFYNIHKDEFNYDLISEKVTHKQKIKIKCNKCGDVFESTVDHHLNQRCGCPFCKNSKGEKRIKNFLSINNITFIPQYSFSDLKIIKLLPFDFYLPELKILIEYDGIQHFKGWSNNKVDLERRKKVDFFKNEYCLRNNIKLIRIPYTDFNNIEYILKKELLTNKETTI